MKVKIASLVHEGCILASYTVDSENFPIVLELSDNDKECIKNMLPECKYISFFPDMYKEKEIEKFIETKGE